MRADLTVPPSSARARFLTGALLSLAVALVAFGCGGGGGGGGGGGSITTTSGTLSIASGSNQSGLPGATLANPLVVSAVGTGGAALSNVTVTFAVTSGGGTLSATTATTNASGLAQVTLTLGSSTGTDTVTASAPGLSGSPVTFTETATGGASGVPAAINGTSGNSQSSGAGAPLASPLLVTVTDASNAPVSNAVVTFSVSSGGGTVGSASATTNSLGQAQTTLQLGPTPGSNSVTASVANVTSSAVFTENGTNLLTPPSTIGGFTNPAAIALVDVNADGFLDLIVVNQNTSGANGTVSVLLGNGAGTFTAAAGSPYAVGAVPSALAVADVNGDSKPDIVVANTGTAGAPVTSLTLLINQGTGAASLFTASASAPVVGRGPIAVAIADMNNDGKPDLIAANKVDGTFTILLGDAATGTFPAASTNPFTITVGGGAGSSSPSSIATGMIHGTAAGSGNDVVVGDSASSNVYYFQNTVVTTIGVANPSIAQGGTAVAVGGVVSSVAVADVNADGSLDLIAASSTGNVSVLLGNGTGTFAAVTGSPFATGTGSAGLALGNVNRKTGSPSIVVANATAGTISVLLDSAGVYTTGGGSPFATGNGPDAVAIGDVNGDGKPDVAVADSTDGTVAILLGQ